MRTVHTTSPEEAAAILRRGGIVAFPTETVYGLGANVFDAGAIAKIFRAKRRPADNPLIAHIADLRQIDDLATEITEITEMAWKFIDAFFPGPLTVVLRKNERVPEIATAGLDTIGIRMPRFDAAHRFLEACGTPVVAPSANLSGRPSPTTWQAVAEDLDGRIDCILQGEPTEIGLESTVVDCAGEVPLVLRAGSVSLEELRKVVPETMAIQTGAVEAPRSPGVRHRHYSPRARVVVVRRSGDENFKFEISNLKGSAFIGLSDPPSELEIVRTCRSVGEYASELFEFFRECDRAGIETIYCESVDESGIGAALMDRINRAAEG